MEESLRAVPLDLSRWSLYKIVEPFRVLGVPIRNLKQQCYQLEWHGKLLSAGEFIYQGARTHIAWGIKSDPHCSYHALALPDGSWGPVIDGCPEYRIEKFEDQVLGFTVDTAGYRGSKQEYVFSWKSVRDSLARFAPLIFFFTLAILWASVRSYTLPNTAVMPAGMQMNTSLDTRAIHQWMLDFMGGFFLIFGLLKVFNFSKFVDSFSAYDIVAQRFRFWAYAYPFVEVGLGILYTFRWYITPANALTLILMTVGCVGIFLKLQRKDEVTCACLGGAFDIPLTGITFLEDFFMANMALLMLLL